MLRSAVRLRFIVATTGCIVDRPARKNADCKGARTNAISAIGREKNPQTGILGAHLSLNVADRPVL